MVNNGKFLMKIISTDKIKNEKNVNEWIIQSQIMSSKAWPGGVAPLNGVNKQLECWGELWSGDWGLWDQVRETYVQMSSSTSQLSIQLINDTWTPSPSMKVALHSDSSWFGRILGLCFRFPRLEDGIGLLSNNSVPGPARACWWHPHGTPLRDARAKCWEILNLLTT